MAKQRQWEIQRLGFWRAGFDHSMTASSDLVANWSPVCFIVMCSMPTNSSICQVLNTNCGWKYKILLVQPISGHNAYVATYGYIIYPTGTAYSQRPSFGWMVSIPKSTGANWIFLHQTISYPPPSPTIVRLFPPGSSLWLWHVLNRRYEWLNGTERPPSRTSTQQ